MKPKKITIEFEDSFVILTGRKAQRLINGDDIGKIDFIPKTDKVLIDYHKLAASSNVSSSCG